MKKRYHYSVLVFLFLVACSAYVIFQWLSLEGKRRQAEHQLTVVIDLYTTLEKNSVQPLSTQTILTSEEKQEIDSYKNTLKEIRPQLRTIEKIEKVRELQRVSFDFFKSATGAILENSSYRSWQRDAGKDGLAYPLLLNYNQAASVYNTSLQQWSISWYARLRGRVIFPLLNVDGTDYQQLPIEV